MSIDRAARNHSGTELGLTCSSTIQLSIYVHKQTLVSACKSVFQNVILTLCLPCHLSRPDARATVQYRISTAEWRPLVTFGRLRGGPSRAALTVFCTSAAVKAACSPARNGDNASRRLMPGNHSLRWWPLPFKRLTVGAER